MTVDMRSYGGEHFITTADVREGPLEERVLDARDGKYDKPELIFESGNVLSLNATNRKTLMRAYAGLRPRPGVGKRVELILGELLYNHKPQEAVVVQLISPPLTAEEMAAAVAAAPKPQPARRRR